MTRTAEDLAEEVEQLRKLRERYDLAVSNARDAFQRQQSLSREKYSDGYRLGAREASEAVFSALMAPLR